MIKLGGEFEMGWNEVSGSSKQRTFIIALWIYESMRGVLEGSERSAIE